MLNLRRQIVKRLSAIASLATTLCVLAAPLASIEHEASVRHITCLEHGELVDAAPLTAAELSAPEHHHARTVAEQSRSSPQGADHDSHCLLATWSAERSTPAHDGQSITAPAPKRALPVVAVAEEIAPAIEMYRLAPKLSPPVI